MLALLLALSWFTVFRLFPFIDNQLPWGLAVLATYGVIAYIGLPALARVWQLLHRPTHVPTRSHAIDGWALDPINIVVVAHSERDFSRAMVKAGWSPADPLNLKSALKMIRAVLFNKSYPTAPFSATYVFGKKQDLCFQMEIGGNPKNRHHVRFWRLGTTLLDDEHEHRSFWQKLLGRFLHNKKDIWVGAASLETGVNLSRRTLQIVHKQQGDTDTERDFLVETLKTAKVLRDQMDIKAGQPLRTRYQGFRETIVADGYVTLCQIRRQLLPPPNLPPDQED